MMHSEAAAAAVPRFAAPAGAARQAALWSLRALLAVLVVTSFAVSAPRGPQQSLLLALGAAVTAGHLFTLGWLNALGSWLVGSTFGLGGLAACGGFALIATLALVELRAREKAGAILALAATLIAALSLFDFARVAGGAATWFWAAAFLLALDAAPRRLAWVAVPVALVWCNVAASGLLAAPLALLIALGRAVDDGPDAPAVKQTLLLALASAAVMLLTPLGFGYPLQAYAALHIDGAAAGVLSLAPSQVAPHFYRPALAAVALGVAALWPYRRSTADALLTAGAFLLVLINGSFLPLLGIIAGPALAGALGKRLPDVAASPAAYESRGDYMVAAGAFALALFAAVTAVATPAAAPRTDPQALVIGLATDGHPHTLVCNPLEWCDDAAAYPSVRVLLDERVEAAPPAAFEAQQQIAHVKAGWPTTLRTSNIDAVLVERTSALAELLQTQPGWSLRSAEPGAELFVRDGAQP